LRHRPAARALVEELDGIVAEIEASGAHLKDVQLGRHRDAADVLVEAEETLAPFGAEARGFAARIVLRHAYASTHDHRARGDGPTLSANHDHERAPGEGPRM